MYRKLIIFQVLVFFIPVFSNGQVKVRLFANQIPESAIFTVAEGKYIIDAYNNVSLVVSGGEPVILSRFNGKVAVKPGNSDGFICDSVIIKGSSGRDVFSLRMIGSTSVKQLYAGDLQCIPDLGTLLFINISEIENYIAGVVKAEGGYGKNLEYFKSQAVLARTYMYKYFNKHLMDRFNLCDNTHCQAFNGITNDSLIIRAANETKGLVVLDKEGSLVISAFHSNCGGETSSPEDVWLFNPPYLKKITDPYCTSSRNATWQKSIVYEDWVSYMQRSGYTGSKSEPSVFNFSQIKRVNDYRAGSFTMPFRLIRAEMNLRSTFFSVSANGDSVLLKGRGYGHGVGLCQEGAMVMAAKGFTFSQIIDFYYSGITVTDIINAIVPENK